MDLTRRGAVAAVALGLSMLETSAFAQGAADGGNAKWDLRDLYPDDATWDAARRAVLARAPTVSKFKGRLGESAAMLDAALSLRSELQRQVARIVTYASLSADADVRAPAGQERQAQAADLSTAVDEATAWMNPEILQVGQPRIAAFIAENKNLQTRFDFLLSDALRQQDHTLSAEGEALMAGAADPLSALEDIRGQLVASDIPWPTVTLSTGKSVRLDDQAYVLNRAAPNRSDRKLVFDTFWRAYGKFQGTIGVNYSAHLKDDVFKSKARRYPSALAMTLSANDIPVAVYRTLVSETNKGLPQLHRYFELRRKLLNLADIGYWDSYVPLVSRDSQLTVPQMRATVLKAVAALGPDYVATLAKATASNWMDPYPRPGKASGAYMNPGAAYDVHPYLLLNLGGDYESMSTYAHEWGHAMHTLLANAVQPYEKAQYTIFTAEIPSTCNEQLLAHYMIDHANTKEEKLYYLGMLLELIRGTYFRQVMLAEFELAVHDQAEAGEGLSGQRFSQIFLDILHRYHGDKVIIPATYGSEWAYVPHFYNSFYLYQYATCIAAASYFAGSVLHGGVAERETYLGVLRAGGSDHPVAILRRAGLDMTSPAPYQAIIKVFSDTLDQCDALLV